MKNKIDKQALREKIQGLEGLSNEDKSQLLALLAEQKKYGLVWEDSKEDAEEVLREKIPVLHEVIEKRLDDGGDDAPNHILIEGDNLYALTALTYTHEGKVDVIYIDPPYNTGNKDFVYNDSFVDSEDSYRHSKWLSFMEKRLRIAKKLLSDKGIIFISIDDNEQANLKLLCDEVFGSENNIATLPVVMNLKGNQDEFAFAGTHEYCIVCCKNKANAIFNGFTLEEEDLGEWIIDDKGYYKKGANLKSTGVNAPKYKRPYLYYPILINNTTRIVSTICKEEYEEIYNAETREFNDNYLLSLKMKYESLGYSFLLPITDGEGMSWRWSRDKVERESDEIIVVGLQGSFTIYKKQRPEIGDLPSKKPKTIFYKPEYSSGNGTALLKDIFGDKFFSNPKPIALLQDYIQIGSQKDSLILDFFAGSGTTLHATMQLNAEDGGHRQCILVTNNENNICEEVTYERNKRVINGYTTPKGAEVEGLKANNLRYYKTDFVSRDGSHQSKKEIAYAMTDLLCIKEGIYDEQDAFGNLSLVGKSKMLRYFAEDGKQMLLIYDSRVIPYIVKEIEQMDKTENDIKIYIFADGSFPYTADFDDVLDKVTLIAMPYAMERALKLVLPEKEDIELEVEPETIEQDA